MIEAVRTPAPASTRVFTQSVGEYALEGRLLFAEQNSARNSIFAVHGARSDYTKLDPLLFWLQLAGVRSLSFNLSGHNAASPVPLSETSLAANLEEARAFYDLDPSCQAILGQSMGGALALKVAEANESTVDKLVLICPAIYPEAAYGPCFGAEFTQSISTPNGFMDSSSISFLRRFRGKVMLIAGEYDGLRARDFGKPDGRSAGHVMMNGKSINSAIPYEVFNAIESAVSPDQLTKIVLPDCDHGVSAWLRRDPERVTRLGRAILEFLGPSSRTGLRDGHPPADPS